MMIVYLYSFTANASFYYSLKPRLLFLKLQCILLWRIKENSKRDEDKNTFALIVIFRSLDSVFLIHLLAMCSKTYDIHLETGK